MKILSVLTRKYGSVIPKRTMKIAMHRHVWDQISKIAQKVAKIGDKPYVTGEIYKDSEGQEYLLEDFEFDAENRVYIFHCMYDDDTRNLVMPLPPVKELAVRDVVFRVGDQYENRNGVYEVLDIDIPNKLLHVRYVDGPRSGEEVTLKALEQYKVIFNMRAEQQKEMGIKTIDFGSDASHYFTVGHFAANGKINVQTPDIQEANVRSQYKAMTGGDFEDGELEVVPHINPTTGKINKFAEQWRIFFPQPSQNTLDNLTLPGDIDIKTTIQNKMLSVNNSNYVKNLIAQHAFRVGRNDARIDNIRDTIPMPFRKVFDDGVEAK